MGVTFLISGSLLDNLKENIAKQNSNLSNIIKEHTEYVLKQPVQELSKLINMIELDSFKNDVLIQDELEDILRFNPFFELIQLLNEDGQITHVAPYRIDHIGLDMSNHSFFVSTRHEFKIVWSDGFISSQTSSLSTTISIPFREGVLIAQLHLDHLSDILQTSVLGKGGFAAITDKKGTIIAHSDKDVAKKSINIANLTSIKNALAGNTGNWEETWNGSPGLASVSLVDINEWTIIVFQPDSVVKAVLSRIERTNLSILVTLFLIALSLQYVILYKWIKPIRKLEDQSRRVSMGVYDQKMKADYREFVSVSNSFNSMAEKIQQREKELRQSEEKFKSMMEGMSDGAYICSQNYIITYLNPAMKEIVGHDVTGQVCFQAFHDREKRCKRCSFDDIEKGKHVEYEMNFKGDNRTFSIKSSPISQSNGEIAKLAIFRDITHIKEMEAQLRQAQKMESIGIMAGGVAHDFNNLLYMIIGNTELALEDTPIKSSAFENLESIKSAGLKAAGIVKQLLDFSRKADPNLKVIDGVSVIKEALEFLRATIPSTINIVQLLPKDSIAIMGDPIQIHQVFMNICTNASQAMEATGGNLDIIVKQVTFEHHATINHSNLAPGAYLKVIIKDSGSGIPKNIKDQIFDPYFTTKEFGKGLGMGLSVVLGIIKSHNGAISVDSSPNDGTAFTIFLPIISDQPESENGEPDVFPKGSETILFIDDEKSLVDMTKKILMRLGYVVDATMDPIKAINLFKENPQTYDLVITDMTMPEMTGLELLEKLKKIRNDIPIIICTGYSSVLDEKKAKKLGVSAYLMKPVPMSKLAKQVRQIMDDPHPFTG